MFFVFDGLDGELLEEGIYRRRHLFFNERKLVPGLQHVKVKKEVQMEKFKNIKGLPWWLDDVKYC